MPPRKVGPTGANEERSSGDLGEHLVRAAAHAFVERDETFFLACEARWARRFAPNGPTLRSLIEAVHGTFDADRSNGAGDSRPPAPKRRPQRRNRASSGGS